VKFPPAICLHCIHLEAPPPKAFMRCEAFTHGIPDEIWQSKIEHRQTYPGDHGIQFEDGDPAWTAPS